MSPRLSDAAAAEQLLALDPAFGPIVAWAGPFRARTRNPDGPFGALARSIVFQQLAGRAAAAIHGRFRALFDGPLTPEAVLAAPEERLRGAGLSAAKAASIRDLAAKVVDGAVPIDRLRRLDDEEIIERLRAVRGIGRWTAEMFLIFELGRLDVWPVDDLGVRNGYALVQRLPVAPTARELLPAGDRYRPLRSVAAWYCWQAVHLARGQDPP